MKNFKILHKDGKARVGELKTAHGVIETPEFNPVGTQATVKAVLPRDLKEIGVQMILANTYHLMLRPGVNVIKKFGGLHKFMGWDRPIMTDSGGFQVFSLGVGLESGEPKVKSKKEKVKSKKETNQRLARVTDEGVTFQSHLDGSRHFLGPEESIKIQHQLGADLIVAFDDHESITQSYKEMEKSLDLTESWAIHSLKIHNKLCDRTSYCPLLYGVVHGGTSKELRIRSAKFTDKHFEAIAIGGIYGTKKQMYDMVEYVLEVVSDQKPRHLLGIGEVEDLFNAIERGVDLFDCVGPTRRARNGSLYICPQCGGNTKNNFTLSISLSKFTKDKNPIDPHCNCYTCLNFSKAYLRHLYFAKEILFYTLATYHNIYFITHLMESIRNAIKERALRKLKDKYMGT